MDPITGVSLVASIVQLVDCGVRVAKTCHELYERGSLSEYESADSAAVHLTSLTESLQKLLHFVDSSQPSSVRNDENTLKDIARGCADCSNELQHELSQLRSQAQGSKREAISKTFNSLRKHGKVVKIQEELEKHRRLLDTSLLIRLNKQFDTERLQSLKIFAQLDAGLQAVIQELANGETSVATLVHHEHERTRRQNTLNFESLEKRRQDDRRFKEVKDSLLYPEIFARQEQIERGFDGIEDSYQWIFDEFSLVQNLDIGGKSSRKIPAWDNFTEWLKYGHGPYWINGKAGSGKSTLMSYICDHETTKTCLRQWSGGNQLLTPTFFFCNAGVQLQKSVDGLLRSLILQMLVECPSLICTMKTEPLFTWTERRLLRTLEILLTQDEIPISVCLFIDGLDEFVGEYRLVLETINHLSDRANVKSCVSSRPLNAFNTTFKAKPSLELHNLTFESIQDYACLQISPLIEQFLSYSSYDLYRAKQMLKRVAERAEGVFLWAVIVVRKLRAGLEDLVDLTELERDVEALPSDVEKLYVHMLTQIKPAYQKDAIRFLLLVVYEGEHSTPSCTLDLHKLSFIDNQHVKNDSPLTYPQIDQKEVALACDRLEVRLRSHTMGLLEIVSIDDNQLDSLYEGIRDKYRASLKKVRIFHRSVKDFLLFNESAKPLLKAAGEEWHLRLSIARGTLSHLHNLSRCVERLDLHKDVWNFLHGELLESSMMQIVEVERLVGVAQSHLMRSLNSSALLPKLVVVDDDYYYGSKSTYCRAPYMFQSDGGIQFDMVGRAAACGMKLYVCEILQIARAYRPQHHVPLPQRVQLSHDDECFVPSLVMDVPADASIEYAHYRQQMQGFLRQESHAELPPQPASSSGDTKPVETYLLDCIWRNEVPSRYRYGFNFHECLALINALLNAGADPMVSMKLAIDEEVNYPCFWDVWLNFLYTNQSFESRHLYFKAIYDLTEHLLNRGAQVNNKQSRRIVFVSGSWRIRLAMDIDFDAMYALENLIPEHPRVRQIATANNPLRKKPWYTIVRLVQGRNLSFESGAVDSSDIVIYPTEQEKETLWPLLSRELDKYIYGYDINLFQALRKIFKAHRPDVFFSS